MVSMTSQLPDVSSLGVVDAKRALREHFRRLRRTRSSRECASLAEELADIVLEYVTDAHCVAAYVSRGQEPRTMPLLAALDRNDIRVLLPALGPGLTRAWAEYRGASDLSVRAPGRPPEPSGDPLGPEALAEADVIVIPALAIDRKGYRLGQGGGWYDRALLHARPDALLVAAVYHEEFLDVPLPRDIHDVPVHAVVTPTRWHRIS